MLKHINKAIAIFAILFAAGCATPSAIVKDAVEKPKIVADGNCSRYAATKDELYPKLNEVAALLLNGGRSNAKMRIAIVDFTDLNGNTSDFGRHLAEELINNLGSKKADMVDRRLLNKALAELKLNNTDLFNPRFAVKFGELTGATVILTGTTVDTVDTVRINSRLIETETARIISTAGIDIPKTVSICKMLSQNLIAGNGTGMGSTSFSVTQNQKIRGKSLIANGDFKSRYEGWERTVGDESKGSSKTEIAKYVNSKSGVGLHIKHVGEGYIQFDQTVDVADTDLVFSATFQAKSNEGPFYAFSGTGITQIVIQYLDENEKALGQTSLVNYVKNPFADSGMVGVPRLDGDTNTTHYIEFKNGMTYRSYKIDIQKELEDNLIGVNHKQVKKVAVAVWCSATNPRAATELWISDISLSYK